MIKSIFFTLGVAAAAAPATTLQPYNVDPNSVSVSGMSSGGFMTAQLAVAYSGTFKAGFGVFAGGPYDCARDQGLVGCTNPSYPSIAQPIRNMRDWSGNKIDRVDKLNRRQVYLHVGANDTVVGVNSTLTLREQLGDFVPEDRISAVFTPGAEHVFPTNFDAPGNSACGEVKPPFIANCGYDGAGEVLKWMYGDLKPRNDGELKGSLIRFSQAGKYGTAGMDDTAVLYVPKDCKDGSHVCKLHVVMHGCEQSQVNIGSTYVDNTGYNKWADTNKIIVLYPQTTIDKTLRKPWFGEPIDNSIACWDWLGQYGNDADWKSGTQVSAIVNMVNRITSGHRRH